MDKNSISDHVRFHDPRMRGFRTRETVEAVVGMIEARLAVLGFESVELSEASERVRSEE